MANGIDLVLSLVTVYGEPVIGCTVSCSVLPGAGVPVCVRNQDDGTVKKEPLELFVYLNKLGLVIAHCMCVCVCACVCVCVFGRCQTDVDDGSVTLLHSCLQITMTLICMLARAHTHTHSFIHSFIHSHTCTCTHTAERKVSSLSKQADSLGQGRP